MRNKCTDTIMGMVFVLSAIALAIVATLPPS